MFAHCLTHEGILKAIREQVRCARARMGTYLGLSQDSQIFASFRTHSAHFFPAMGQVHRSTFVRQAANLWAIKERLWMALRDELIRQVNWWASSRVCLFRSVALPEPPGVFVFAVWRDTGKIMQIGKPSTAFACICDWVSRESLPVRTWLQPMNPMEKWLPWCWKERRDSSREIEPLGFPHMQASLRKNGMVLQAPYRTAHASQAAAYHSSVLGQVRYRIDTVFGQLTDRCQLKRVWARDLWHLRSRLLRCILMHTLCV